MAKGQQRGNKEARKPKQPKAAPKAEGTFANQLKTAATAPKAKSKG